MKLRDTMHAFIDMILLNEKFVKKNYARIVSNDALNESYKSGFGIFFYMFHHVHINCREMRNIYNMKS